MRIEATLFIIDLTLTSISGNGVLQRLENPKYDSEDLRKINSVQRQLDIFLKKNLRTFSNLEEPYALEPLNYYEDHIEMNLNKLKLTVQNASISARADLHQQMLRIEIAVINAHIDGISIIKSVSPHLDTNFRFSSKNITCSGTAGLLMNTNEITCEWALIDCVQKQFTPIEHVVFNRSAGNLQDSSVKLEDVNIALLRSIETVLNSESLLKLNDAIRGLPVIVKNQLYSIGNRKSARLETADSNTFLDSAISVAAYYIKERYNDSVQVPDIKEAIPCSLLTILRCDTGFTAQNGFARDVSTLQRVGNARITRRNETVDFSSTLKFQKLNIFYNKYKASVLGIGPSGRLRLLIRPVTVGIRLKINFRNRRIYLTGFKLKRLGKTQVEVSGLGKILGTVLRSITTYIVGIFNVIISRIIEQRVATYTKEALEKNSIDDIINGNITI